MAGPSILLNKIGGGLSHEPQNTHQFRALSLAHLLNLPANRIADMDRRGEKWRIFNEINVVNLQYKPIPYTDWQPLPSGLNGSVRLTPVTYK